MYIQIHNCRQPPSILFFPKEGKDALFRAAKEGDIEAVRRQLTGHISVNSQDKVVIECPVIFY